MAKTRLPRHIGFIPDGNRRWAAGRGLPKQDGYEHGIGPGVALYELCRDAGIGEISIYCFTKDNLKRPSVQAGAFRQATVAFADAIAQRGAAMLVVGDMRSPHFPPELVRYERRQGAGMKVNLLVNYGWDWNLDGLRSGTLRSDAVSRMDLIVRWGGGRRLSGFLPVQAVYADFFVCDALWPDFEPSHFAAALDWFGQQDRTLGG